jgi:predicted nucleic acid-binding protein
MRIFLDTNIILNAFLNRDDDISSQVIAYLLAREYEVYINNISIINIDYHLKKEFSKEYRKQTVQFLIDTFELLQNKKHIFQSALDSDFSDFEDAIQYFSSKDVNANLIMSDDKKGFKDSTITVFKAKEFFNTYVK